MLYTSLFRRAVALQVTSNTFRSFSSSAVAMASPPQSFTLDRGIFNQTLYSEIRDFWFAGLPEGATAANYPALQKWYGVGLPPEQKKAFDGECHGNFGHALKAIGPEKLALPTFESFEKDIENAATTATPLLNEVKEAQAQDEKKGADTLLSLILLLDQMPRNIYRDPAGLGLVYHHYDRLSLALLYSSMNLSPNPVEYSSYRLRPVIRSWYLMPLIHAEHLSSHDLFSEITKRCRKYVADAGDTEALVYVDMALKAEEDHLEPLTRFGRYPHRNEALGRQSTPEEVEFLKTGKSFGVQQSGEKDIEKSEL